MRFSKPVAVHGLVWSVQYKSFLTVFVSCSCVTAIFYYLYLYLYL